MSKYTTYKQLKKMKSYCLRCRKDTENIDPKVSNTSNSRKTILSKCARCGSKKSKFIKNQKAKGLLIDLGVRTPLSKVSILGDILFWTHAELYIKMNEIVNFFSFNNFYQVVINLCQKCI